MNANLAVVIHGAGDVRVEERPTPTPQPDEAIVEIVRGGICGSDISYFNHGAVGDFRVRRPMVLGHEVVGRVADTGSALGDRQHGDLVVVNPSSPCMQCARCREGRSNACLEPVFLGSASTDPHVDGGFVRHLPTRAANLVAVPRGLALTDVVFAEPLAVTVHAINRAGGVADKRILVVGAGPIGAMTLAAARSLGAGEIDVVDLSPERLSIAAGLGADHTFGPDDEIPNDPINGYDVVFEASGSGAGIASAVGAVRKAGTVVLIGLPHGGPVALPIGLGVARELDLLGSFRFTADEFEQAVQLLGDGLDLSTLRTHDYSLDSVETAFVTASGADSMKVQLDFEELT